jgi:HTH-type transcriptional regulator / antitoxin HigA
MSDTNFEPDWMSAPGATISAMLERKRLTVKNFAELMGYSVESADKLLNGRAAITRNVAECLASKIGGSVQFWISREEQYRGDIARLQGSGNLVAARAWLSELPVRDMITFGWIESDGSIEGKIASCLRFFDVSDVSAWREKYKSTLSAVAFRTSLNFDSEPGSVISWLRHAQLRATAIQCKSWNPKLFRESLANIRELTRYKNPNLFVHRLRQICADSGVAVVIARAPVGCRASGATQFVTQNKAMILLSFRYLSDDQFWFTFFHEAGHLILHSKSALFLEDGSDVTSGEENEANNFSEQILIPPRARDELRKLPLTKHDIMKFGVKAGVSRGIIVGQLQHMKRLKPDQLNWMKLRYKWENIDV